MTWGGEHAIANGDVLSVLRELPDNEFDASFYDPPYGLGNHQPTVQELIEYLRGAELDTGGDFMGKDWHVPSVTMLRELYRVLKPGAPLLSYGGSRTGWLISLGLCAAGFELRDELAWLYGKGFPKSLDVDKALARSMSELSKDPSAPWKGYGTALKPAREPIYLARKPLEGTIAQNVTKWGVGGLAIDACRIGRPEGDRASGWSKTGSHAGDNVAMSGGNTERAPKEDAAARWPANLILDEETGEMLDAQVGESKSVPFRENTADGAVLPMKKRTAGGYSDSGGPSRFFYSAKVSTKEREHGCLVLPRRTAGEVTGGREDDSAAMASPRTGAGRTGGAHNHHPTLKPISLSRWLSTLIKPPTDNATLLVPYSGAGSEMIGALQAGWPMVLGIERDAEYVAIANARLAAWKEGEP